MSCFKPNIQGSVIIGLIVKSMPKRTSVNEVQNLDDLNDLERIVRDKRNHKRADAKKERRNRHYTKVLIKYIIKQAPEKKGLL